MKDIELNKFRYWCHKVLPLVYDDSLSYYEILCKVTGLINNLIETDKEIFGDIDNIETQMKILQEEIDNLQEFSIDYFYERSWLNGKKVVVYGDSTIYKPNGGLSYMDIVENICNCTVTNRAIAGTAMNFGTNNGTSLVSLASDLETFDTMFLAYGTNEWQAGRKPDEIRNDIITLLTTVFSKNPRLEIVFVNPFYSSLNAIDHPNNFNNCGMSLEKVNEIIQNELYKRNITYIDLYRLTGCSVQNYTKFLDESGDTGIYVHPNNKFKKQIASIIFKGGNSNTKMFSTHSMLKSYDFVVEQNAVTAEEYGTSGRFGDNLTIKISANTTASSTQKVIDNNESSEYVIIGNTTQAITLEFGGTSVNVSAGRFKINLTNLSSTFDKLKITTTAQTIVSELQLYHITTCGNSETDMYKFGRKKEFTSESVHINVKPSFHFNEVGININIGTFTLSAEASANTNLLLAPSDINFGQSYGLIQNLTTGDYYTVEIIENKIRNITVIPAGFYILFDKLICLPYNRGLSM